MQEHEGLTKEGIWQSAAKPIRWEGSETIMGTSLIKEDGIVHSLWKHRV